VLKRTKLALILAILATTAGAETPLVGDLSDEDRRVMIAGAMSYEKCLRGQSQARLAEHADVRTLLDAAMGECAALLQTLEGNLLARHLNPELVAGFSRRIRIQSTRKLLPEIMSIMAARPSG